MGDSEVKPSSFFYFLATLILITGISISIPQLIRDLGDLENNLQQFIVPGKSEIDLKESGDYTIYLETRSTVNGVIYTANGSVSGLRYRITDKSNGEVVELSRPQTSSSYRLGGRAGHSTLDFKIDKPGAYEIAAQYDGNREGPQVVLAVGKGFVGKMAKVILIFVFELIIIIAVSVGMVLITHLKRKKYQKELTDDSLY